MALTHISGVAPEVINAVAAELNIAMGVIGLSNELNGGAGSDRSVEVAVKNVTTHRLKFDQCFMAEGHQSVPMPPTILPLEERRSVHLKKFNYFNPLFTDVKGMFSLRVEGFPAKEELYLLVMFGVCKFSWNYFGLRVRTTKNELNRGYFDGWAAAQWVTDAILWAKTDASPDGQTDSIYACDGQLCVKGPTPDTCKLTVAGTMGDAHHCHLLIEVNCCCSQCEDFAKRVDERLLTHG